MVHWEGNIQPRKHKKKYLIDYSLSSTVSIVSCDDEVDRAIPSDFNVTCSLETMLEHVSMAEKLSYGFKSCTNSIA